MLHSCFKSILLLVALAVGTIAAQDTGGKFVHIRTKYDNGAYQYLGVSSSSNGKALGMYGKADGANILWEIREHDSGGFAIIPKSGPSFAVDADGSTMGKDGSKVQLWKRFWGPNQRWKFDRQKDGSYRISSMDTKTGNRVLDVDLAGGQVKTKGGKVHLWTLHSGDNQKWMIENPEEKWGKMPGGNAVAIAAGGTKVMLVNKENNLYEWNFKTENWMRTGRKAIDVAVDHENTIWTVEPNGDVYAFYPGSGKSMKTASNAKVIGAGGTKAMYANNNGDLYEWNYKKKEWMRTGRKAIDVTVDDQNTIWTIQSGRSIHRFYPKSGKSDTKAGTADRIAAGGQGRVAMVGNQNVVFRHDRGRADANLGYKAADVAVDKNNAIWIASTDGSVYRYN